MTKGICVCKGCGDNVPTNESKIYSGKKYCSNCYELKLQERHEYEELIKSITQCFNIDVPTGLILKQIKEYKEQFAYTYAGMHYCLWYCSEIKNLKFDIKYGIAIIKYEYENAKNYFLQQQKVTESVKNMNHEERVRVIKVSKSTRKDKNNLLIDIEAIINSEGGVHN